MTTPPGWYPDISSGPGAVRWWDGERWTEHVSRPQLPPPPVSPTRTALSREAGLVRTARAAAVATTVAVPVSLAFAMVSFVTFADVIDDIVSGTGEVTSSSFQLNPLVSLGSNLASITVFAAWVITLVWVHASASTAAELRLPARRTPGWVVGGFLIPVVNLWWPYQSVCDLFPEGDAARGQVRLWWAQYLAAVVVQLVGVGAVFFVLPVAVVAVAVAALLQVGAALALRRVIALAASTHASLAEAAVR